MSKETNKEVLKDTDYIKTLNFYECLICGWTFMGNVKTNECIICRATQKEE